MKLCSKQALSLPRPLKSRRWQTGVCIIAEAHIMAYGTVRGGRYAGYGALSSVRDCLHLPPGAGTVPSLVGACEAVIWSSTTAGGGAFRLRNRNGDDL